ncbi:lysine-specific demethylase rbr-2-like isoform X1 [Papaver somniferum]|uniref:lysine-specific demethylase rbr-2-like isoform X1 n=1 Tax=Papaver somniferum TaxID=3469 RepID=UPI000E6F6554|nr:lysine-specific demethylase rbr-2-like isoform X1 [Papaver somniferum]
MGKGRPRSVEKGVLGNNNDCLLEDEKVKKVIPQGPVYYPTDEEFKDPLEYIYKIRPEAEPYGICRIIPPNNWKPPFALDLESFTFPTKTQAIHQLQARSASCDPQTFELEYNRFLETQFGKRNRKKVVFEGEDLDFCKCYNAVKRYGGYDKVVKEKKWGEVYRFIVGSAGVGKISECSKHVLSQLYREHLYDYEMINKKKKPLTLKKCKRGMRCDKVKKVEDQHSDAASTSSSFKRRKKNSQGDVSKDDKLEKKKEELNEFDQICEQCNSGLHGEVMLLCDRCNKGWHIYCLSPPLKQVPTGNWYCLECVNSEKDSFGFVPGKRFSLETFRRLADRAKKKWFGSTTPSRVEIEKKFWEIVEGSVGEVEVMYGSDLDTSKYGSGFPRAEDSRPPEVEVEVWDKYISSPWNLNNLPKLQGSMLQAVHENIAGVMVPWLYIGMLFSSFCWHFEDHCFYSMNYLHWGEPKCWYSVPGSEAHAFEQVMRSSLPDLFETQPDLLFQLVTMLNPSVLQDNGVPVYTVLQEPGNIVITFPRSYHGGFNFGLNCAEAVNFAPADWLPHGGYGAELYRLYHKAAVLSHEELLCVVAKSGCDAKVSSYLKKELHRVFTKEKTWRERLWKNGIVKTSPMYARKHPDYVGTEEDPTCIICQQYLYLSAVGCGCRKSTFVCLEHYEHLCECNPAKQRLLYRHTLAELEDLALLADNGDLDEACKTRSCRRQLSSSNDVPILAKEVKGCRVTHVQLAEEWILSTIKILESSFSESAYVSALSGAQQFLWAGPEMDPVRGLAKSLVEAKKWALEVKSCLCKVKSWLQHRVNNTQKVTLGYIENLLSFNPVPCNEPGHLKLKVYTEEAKLLVLEIKSALSPSSGASIADLELLYFRASECPIHIEEMGNLAKEISLAKAWIDSTRQCISVDRSVKVEVDVLHKLKSEMLELHVQFPEMEVLLDILRQVESWQVKCHAMLEAPITLKDLEILLQDADNFFFAIPELKLLKQYHLDAISWISRFHHVLVNVNKREDQDKVVEELTCISADGALLRVQVDELPLVEVELKKAFCREKAQKASRTQMPLTYIEELISEAVILQIEDEKWFKNISGVLADAQSWEERAKQALRNLAQMSDLEDLMRTSDKIFAVLPSLVDLKDVLSFSRSWIRDSQPFLTLSLLSSDPSSSPVKFDSLKELVSQSKLLKVCLEEPRMLQETLKDCESWLEDARALLEQADSFLMLHNVSVDNGCHTRIVELLQLIQSVTMKGQLLGVDFDEIPKLQKVSSKLEWCLRAITSLLTTPSLKAVDSLIESAKSVPRERDDLVNSLIDGVIWLKKALEIVSSRRKRCKLSDVEEIVDEAQMIKVPFPLMVDQLVISIEKHKSWLEKVHVFFSSNSAEKSWSALLQLKDFGDSDAFDSPELDRVNSEIVKVEKWILSCKEIIGPSVSDMNSLGAALVSIKHSMDRSIQLYQDASCCSARSLHVCCFSASGNQEVFVCLKCNDRYHLSCLGSMFPITSLARENTCPYCLLLESGAVSRNECRSLISRGARPELKMLNELLSVANDFCMRIKEIDILEKLVEQTLACQSLMAETVDFVLGYLDKDIVPISRGLLVPLKAVGVAGVFDHDGTRNLELAVVIHSWKIRVKMLFENSEKPHIQNIQRMLKEGSQLNVPSGDYFIHELTKMKCVGLHWAELARKVASDSGHLELDEVFKLISEGEDLPVHLDKEIKLLRDRTVLYCICRKPYNNKAPMIACDLCEEWYHFDCVKICEPAPNNYLCPACKPLEEKEPLLSLLKGERLSGSHDVGPQTPLPQGNESRRRHRKLSSNRRRQKRMLVADLGMMLRHSDGIDQLWWRNRKPLRRTSKKRAELESLSPFYNL